MIAAIVLGFGVLASQAAMPTAEEFKAPARSDYPETWFHVIGGNFAKEGLAADVKALREAGIQGIQFFHGQFGGPWPGMEERQVPCLSSKWDDLVTELAELCRTNGLTLKLQNCPGWSMSGGPWITHELAMRNLTFSRTDVERGKTEGAIALAKPTWQLEPGPDVSGLDYRDLFVLAFPTPEGDTPGELAAEELSRSDEGGVMRRVYRVKGKVRAIAIPSPERMNNRFEYECGARVKLTAVNGSERRVVMDSPVPQGAWQDEAQITFACDEAEAESCEFEMTHPHPMSVNYVKFFDGARLDNWEGQAGWVLRGLEHGHEARQNAAAYVKEDSILDLTDKFADGRLAWRVPEGRWTILRIGHINNGKQNAPAPAEATGWECNKMDPRGIECNYANYVGRLVKGPLKGLVKGMVIDSWECRRQTWTEKMEAEFRSRAGYDLRKKIPALFGWVLGTPEATRGFLRDWRDVCGSLIEENYYRRLVELGHEDGLEVQYETAFGDVLPGDLMKFWKYADTPMCEFWQQFDDAKGEAGSYNFKPSMPCVSAARMYGKRRVAAESFTWTNLSWNEDFLPLKDAANRHFARGVTHLVFHTYTHNPRTDWKLPGSSFGTSIGTPFVRGQTWWKYMPELTAFSARCGAMLEAGRPAERLQTSPVQSLC